MDYAIKIVEQSGKDLTDYQIRIEIMDEEFFSKCTDPRYVEFYDEDKQTLLSHYTELFDTANKIAIFWVKVPSIPANGTKMIYLNINISRMEDLSDGEATFDFFDDFEGSELDTNKWTPNYVNSVDYEVVNSNLRIKDATKSDSTYWIAYNTDTGNQIKANFTPLDRMVIEWKQKMETQDSADQLGEVGIGLCKDDKTIEVFLCEVDQHDNVAEYLIGKDIIGEQHEVQNIAINPDTYYVLRIVKDGNNYKLEAIDEQGNVIYSPVTGSSTALISYMAVCVGAIGGRPFSIMQIDWVRVRKYTDPEPSVTVIKLGATPTYDLKLKIAQALAGETTTILDTDPKLRLLSGNNIIKELSLTAKTVYKDATNKRIVVAFLFVDDSSDSYTTDNQELLFTKDNVEYVAFKSSKSFTKEANKRLPLRWEIYLPYDVDVCTYEESMVTCL